MIYCVEVSTKPGIRDARGESVRRQIEALGIDVVQTVSITNLYFLQGDLDGDKVDASIDTLLHDPVVEQARWHRIETLERETLPPGAWSVEVTLLPGVTDSVAESLLAGARLIGVPQLEQAATGQRYVLLGALSHATVDRIASSLLANGVIQTYHVNALAAPPFVRLAEQAPPEQIAAAVDVIAIRAADQAGLLAISRERRLSLDLAEMQALQAYYRHEGREPTDVELETLAQTWSEHCVHKTFRAVIEYTERGADITTNPSGTVPSETTNSGTGNRRAGEGVGGSDEVRTVRIDGLLKTYIRAATEKVNKPWIRSAFVDNAGIVQFDDQYDLAFKVETHNHPSALEPFGGANTGVGGVVRDVIGVSARPIANTDVLCFGPQDLPFEALPAGVLHPRRIASGVIAGIEDYGNKMGIPTVNGAFLYDPGYTANPLVFCGCLGILPHGSHPTTPQAGDLAVVMGGRTGRDGLARRDFFLYGDGSPDRRDRRQRSTDRPSNPRETGLRGRADCPRRRAIYSHHRLRRGRLVVGGRRDGQRPGRDRASGAGAAEVSRPATLGDLAQRGAGAYGAGRAARQLAATAGNVRRPGRRRNRAGHLHRRRPAADLLRRAARGQSGRRISARRHSAEVFEGGMETYPPGPPPWEGRGR